MPHTAFITGGSKRIGARICHFLASKRYNLVIHYNSSEKLAISLKKELEERYPVEIHLYQGNLEDPLLIEKLISKILNSHPKIDIIINNASVFYRKTIAETSFSELQKIMNVNFFSPYVIIKKFAEKNKKGNIINLLDSHINRNQNQFAAYQLSKKILQDLTKMAAKEFAPKIRVNGISPGMILPKESETNEYLDYMRKLIPLRKLGNTDNLLQTINFILENNYITGQVIAIDGGKNIAF